MNYVEQRLAGLLMTPDKYSHKDLHKVKNCLCFIRDCVTLADSEKAEKFLAEFIRRKEAGIQVNVTKFELEYGIEN
jgi:hypothetical protein